MFDVWSQNKKEKKKRIETKLTILKVEQNFLERGQGNTSSYEEELESSNNNQENSD